MRHTPLPFMALAGALAACTPSSDPVQTQFHREAGALIDTGHFGHATVNNMAYMKGELRWTYELSTRFAQEVETTVNFAFNSSQLGPLARDILREQAAWIRQFPEATFRVYGHTDKVGSAAYNRRLGLARANAVVNFLVSHGVSRSRLEAVVSYGERQPLIVTEGRERRNRRTVTEVSGFVSSHPTVLDGKYAEIIYREYVASAVPTTNLTTGTSSGDQVTTGDGGG